MALTHRADVLAALAEYAAAEALLRSEIAKQYPDIHLNPGYSFDTGAWEELEAHAPEVVSVGRYSTGIATDAGARAFEAGKNRVMV